MSGEPTVQIYGAGRTGLAVARLARDRGVRLVGVWNRRPLDRARATLAQGLPLAVDPQPVPAAADLWLLSVADDAIAEVAEMLATGLAAGGARPAATAHCAGARGSEDLAALAAAGVPCGSWHPAMTFRGAPSDAGALALASVAIEGSATAVLASFSAALGLPWHPIAAAWKARYHSALVLAANGRVALEAAAERLLADAGLDAEAARRLLAPLVARTEENLRTAGPRAALTGPVARGDAATVRAQLRALRDRPPIQRLYRALGEVALTLVPESERTAGHRGTAELVETESDLERC